MTGNSAFSGAYNKNPFAFKHFNLEFMALYRDGIQIPSKPLQPEYESGAAVRTFINSYYLLEDILKITLWQ